MIGTEEIITARRAVVRIAREWINTPYHSAACIKGVGCDCLTFISGVYEEARAIEHLKFPYYSEMWHLSRSEELYLNGLNEHCVEVEAPHDGDIAVYKIGRVFSHAAIVLHWPQVCHSVIGRGVILTDATNDGNLINRPVKFFRLKKWVEDAR